MQRSATHVFRKITQKKTCQQTREMKEKKVLQEKEQVYGERFQCYILPEQSPPSPPSPTPSSRKLTAEHPVESIKSCKFSSSQLLQLFYALSEHFFECLDAGEPS